MSISLSHPTQVAGVNKNSLLSICRSMSGFLFGSFRSEKAPPHESDQDRAHSDSSAQSERTVGKRKSFTHLKYSERVKIYTLNLLGWPNRRIAKFIDRDRRTVDREIERNKGVFGYHFNRDQAYCVERRRMASSKARKMTEELLQEVRHRLNIGWSHEQISDWFGRHGRTMCGPSWIYEYIRRDRKQDGRLFKLLRHKGKKRNKRTPNGSGRGESRTAKTSVNVRRLLRRSQGLETWKGIRSSARHTEVPL